MSRAKKLKEWEKLRNIDAESNSKILSEDQYVKIAEVLSLIEHNQLIDENLVGLGWRVGPNLEWARDELWQLEPIYLPPYSRCIKAGRKLFLSYMLASCYLHFIFVNVREV